jgi:hypothetical protein
MPVLRAIKLMHKHQGVSMSDLRADQLRTDLNTDCHGSLPGVVTLSIRVNHFYAELLILNPTPKTQSKASQATHVRADAITQGC